MVSGRRAPFAAVSFLAAVALVGGCGMGDSVGEVLVSTSTVAPSPSSTSSSAPTATSATSTSATSTSATSTSVPPLVLKAFDVAGLEYEYRHAPTIPPTGLVRFTNEGLEDHELILGPIVAGNTVADVLAAPDFSAVVTDPIAVTAAPGETTEIAVPIIPGTYILVCYIQNDAGESHVDLGMVSTLEVVGGE